MARTRAVERLIENANKGNCESMSRLAERYYNGNGIEQDFEQSFRWNFKAMALIFFQRQRNSGKSRYEFLFAKTAMRIAECFEKGLGVKKDLEKAFTWYRIVVDNVDTGLWGKIFGEKHPDNFEAQNNLIRLLENNPELKREVGETDQFEFERKHEAHWNEHDDLLFDISGYTFYKYQFEKNDIFRREYAAGRVKYESVSQEKLKMFIKIVMVYSLGLIIFGVDPIKAVLGVTAYFLIAKVIASF